MRIIGYIENQSLKITVFKDNGRVSIKFENGQYEQVYKFRDGSGIESLGDATGFVDAPFLEQVSQNFAAMNNAKMLAFSRKSEVEEDEFEDII